MVGGVITGVWFCGLRAATNDAPCAAPLHAGRGHCVFAPVAALVLRQQAFTVAKHLSVLLIGKWAAAVDEAPGALPLRGERRERDGVSLGGEGRLARGAVARGGEQASGGQCRCGQCSLQTSSQNHFQESTLCAYKVKGAKCGAKDGRTQDAGRGRAPLEVFMCAKIFCLLCERDELERRWV